ncbi:MAG: MaoC/PaaZ C-terminal domain-containing protein [Dehalococcoidia bacterium]|nr:MaoC/PaaZ C-terminal domain-containing protein [Dehalococcoidia bacterium]MDD5494729.1 MaoC/PaaZ C-terminal domain-containing protein [Dehalococcoidia bacterium]
MVKQIYYEDVEIGSEVTPLEKIATTRMLVQYAGASGDFNPLHYEDDFAKNLGVGHPIVHGLLKRAWLVNLMIDWIGAKGKLKKLSCRYRGVDYPRKMKTLDEPLDGDTWWCRGKVTRKYVEGDECLVECEIWVENGNKEKTTTGSAVVVVPSKLK